MPLTFGANASSLHAWIFPLRIAILVILFGVINQLSTHAATFLFVAAGHAHFLQAYLAQYRAGKFSRNGVLAFLLILPLAYYMAFTMPYLFVAFVSILFLVHNYTDDMHLLANTHKKAALWVTLPVFIIYTSLSLQENKILYIADAGLTLGVTFFMGALLYVLFSRSYKDAYVILTILQTIIIIYICFFLNHWTSLHLFSFIVMGHVMNWYVHLLVRCRLRSAAHMRFFAVETTLANLFFFGLPTIITLMFFTFINHKLLGQSIYNSIFSLQAFSVWALLHMLVSLRYFKPKILLRP